METRQAAPKSESGALDILSVRVDGDRVVFVLGEDDLLQMGISEATQLAYQIGNAIFRSTPQESQ